MRTILRFVFISLWLVSAAAGYAQSRPFQKEIAAFHRLDSLQTPPDSAILLVGSSSFTLWKDVQDYFPGRPIINRGFGGSTLLHQILWADEVIFPYRPAQIVVYCGENDLSSSPQVTADSVLQRFQRLYGLIRQRLPRVPVVYVAMKPSPSRAQLLPQMKAGNALIRQFLHGEPNTAFVDVFTPMLNAEGQPRQELFLQDRLHMNPEGYRLWQQHLKPYLLNP